MSDKKILPGSVITIKPSDDREVGPRALHHTIERQVLYSES